MEILAEIKEHERQKGKKRKVQQAENNIIGTTDAKLKKIPKVRKKAHIFHTE